MSNNPFNPDKNTTNAGHFATPGDKGDLPAKRVSSTLSALGPVTSEAYPADRPTENEKPVENTTHPAWTDPGSTTSTPGQLHFPGSYPGPVDSKEETKDVKEVTATALETAKEYVVTAGETVSGYLPESVAAYLRELRFFFFQRALIYYLIRCQRPPRIQLMLNIMMSTSIRLRQTRW